MDLGRSGYAWSAIVGASQIHSFLPSLGLMKTICVRVAWRLCYDTDKAEEPDCRLYGQTCGTLSFIFIGNVTEGANGPQWLSPKGRALVTQWLYVALTGSTLVIGE